MALLNHAKKELSAKIVYYGPGLSGKTTNLEWIHRKWEPDKRGKLISLETKTDRTLFFDFLPVQIGEISGYRTRFNVYTVPGQIFYNETRKMVLKGVDGVVFVADSQKEMSSENVENLKNLAENLRSIGKDLGKTPMVLQYNKRDLPNTLTVEELNRLLNPEGFPFFEAIAVQGEGVLTTLTRITRMVADHLKDTLFASKRPEPPEPEKAPSFARNVHSVPSASFAASVSASRSKDSPSFLNEVQGNTAPARCPESSGMPDFGITAHATETVSEGLTEVQLSEPVEMPNLFAEENQDPGHSEGHILSQPESHLPPPLSDPGVGDDMRIGATCPDTDSRKTAPPTPDPVVESFSSETYGPTPPPVSGVNLPLSAAEPEHADTSTWMDPSVVSTPPPEPGEPESPGDVSILLGNPERSASNEIRIPLSIRKDKTGERLSFHVNIRIEPNGHNG